MIIANERMREIANLAITEKNFSALPDWYEDFLKDKKQYYRSYMVPKKKLQKELDKGVTLGYSKNHIPKHELSKWRKISAPVPILRDFQAEIAEKLKNRSPSKFDFCVSGRSRFDAMRMHAGKKIIIAMDIKDAFPSTTIGMIFDTLIDEGFETDFIRLVCNVCTLDDCLPQGSPASPILLNLCRKMLDYRIAGLTRKMHHGTTSVYVDNYYISSNDPEMHLSIPRLKQIAKEEQYIFSDDKIHIMRYGTRQSGLGLVTSVQPHDDAEGMEGCVRIHTKNNPNGIWGKVTVQPDRKFRNRLRATLHQALKRAESGEPLQDGFRFNRVSGLIECMNGSIYYDRLKEQLSKIRELVEV